MSVRIYVVILVFWVVLTFVSPVLVRMSASAKHHLEFHGSKSNSYSSGEENESILDHKNGVVEEQYKGPGGIEVGLLPRRALVNAALVNAALFPAPASAPAPAPAPAPKSAVEGDVFPLIRFILK